MAPLVRLRRATVEDAAEVAAIWYPGWCDAHLGNVPQRLVDARPEETFEPRAVEHAEHTTVAVAGGEIAGFVMVVGDEVEQVYVAAAHRGSGVAAALLTAAEREVAAGGHERPGSRSSRATSGHAGSTNGRAGWTRAWSSTGHPTRTAHPGPGAPLRQAGAVTPVSTLPAAAFSRVLMASCRPPRS